MRAGHLVIALATEMQGRFSNLVGIDLSDVRVRNGISALETQYQHLHPHVELKVVDADRPLPFDDEQFDVVVCCAVVEHVVDVFKIMREASRVCRTGGAIIMTVPNLGYIRHVGGLLFGRLPLTGIEHRNIVEWEWEGWDGGHLHYFTKPSVSQLLGLVGFVPEVWTSDGRLAKLRRWSRLLSGNLTVRARKRGVL